MASQDKNWAKEYILDPLTAPQPADETGPGTHFRPEPEDSSTTQPQSLNTRKIATKEVPTTTTELSNGYPSPRQSPSHRQEAFGAQQRRSRGNSLGERFPGDKSHRPLDQLRYEKAVADKARHTTKKHNIRPDGVDLLDESVAGGAYHHGGPYDATLFARNNSYNSSPVQAVSGTTAETIKATPKERLMDSIQGHRPLDGVAEYAPGQTDQNGHVYNYGEENMMIENDPPGGAYKRWPGIQYHPDDIKGKGEPSYSLEKAIKKHDDPSQKDIEMTDRPRGSSMSQALKSEGYDDGENQIRRSGSFGKRLSGGLKKRIGSLQRGSRNEE